MGSNNNNSNLHKAKAIKDDEFYTKLADIEMELQYYAEHFKDKIIYCNCDDPRKSKFWEYFHTNFSKLSLKSLRATFYNGCPSQNRLFQIPYTSEVFYAEYRGGQDEDLSCYDKTTLLGNGSFNSKECVEILKTSDIVVTNPPFSLFREYMQVLLKYSKDFIILGSYSALTYKMMFTAYMEKRVFLGQHVDTGYFYTRPDGSEWHVCSNWYTSFSIKRIIPKLQLTKHYTPEEYPKYDNFDAIHVESIRDIPIDYDGYMGVPLNFIDFVNNAGYAEFDIVKFRTGADNKDLRLSSIYNDERGVEPLVPNYHSTSSELIGTLTSQVEVDSLYQDQNDLQDYVFKLIGEMNHGCDCDWDLAKPILNGVDKFKRYIIQKVENNATNRTEL